MPRHFLEERSKRIGMQRYGVAEGEALAVVEAMMEADGLLHLYRQSPRQNLK